MIYFNWPPGPFLATQYDKEPGGAGFEANRFYYCTIAITAYHKMLAAMLLNQKAWLVSPSISIEDFSKDCAGTRYGASPARNDCDVCVSRLICHLFFDFGKPTIDHCCVPRFSNGRRTSPSLSYHSFPLSRLSELRKHWLDAGKDEGVRPPSHQHARTAHRLTACRQRLKTRKSLAPSLKPLQRRIEMKKAKPGSQRN